MVVYKSFYGGRERFRVSWFHAGERKWRGAMTEKEALAIARDRAQLLNAASGEEVIDRSDAQEWRRAVEIAAAHGRTLLGAVREWRAMILARGDTQRRRATIADLAEEMAAARRQDGATPTYCRRLERELLAVHDAFEGQTIDTITTDDLETWLRARDIGPRRRKNLRALLVNLWRHARRRGALPDAPTAAEKMERVRVRQGRVEIYRPGELRALLAAAEGDMVAWLAICAFSGVRSEGEISRLRWEDVRADRGLIDVTESKTGRRRLVPIQPNLALWLKRWEGASGPILTRARVDRAIPKVSSAAGVRWIRNGLRHSYGSYRCAVTADVPRVAYEMGNSPEVVKAHYLERVPEADGAEWFAIAPGS